MINNYWAKQAAQQLQLKQKELRQKNSLQPVARANKQSQAKPKQKTRYFLNTKGGGCGCGN